MNIKMEFDKVNSKLDRLEKLVEALAYPVEPPLELYKVNKSVEVSADGGRKNTKSSNRSSK